MKRILPVILLYLFTLPAFAQGPLPAARYQPFGVIDTADLTMKQCDFEKDANAELLFDKEDYIFESDFIT